MLQNTHKLKKNYVDKRIDDHLLKKHQDHPSHSCVMCQFTDISKLSASITI